MKKDSVKYTVGDKVRLVSKRPNAWNCQGEMDHYLGKEVILSHVGDFGILFNGSHPWAFSINDIECKIGCSYVKLKDLSPRSIWENDPAPCIDQFSLYLKENNGMFFEDRDLADVLVDCDKYSQWLPWLIEYGYVKKKQPSETEYKFELGNSFIIGGDSYILAHIGCNRCLLIGLLAGNFFSFGVTVENIRAINKMEFIEMIGSQKEKFNKIYATKNKVRICY